MKKAIFFDLDGTIADSIQIGIECANDIAKKYGIDHTIDFSRLRESSTRKIVREDLQLSLFQIAKYLSKGRRLMRAKAGDIRVFPGIKSVLKRLGRRYEIVIVTSNLKKTAQLILSNAGIDIVTKVYAGRALFGKHKMIRKALRKMRLRPADVIYVGDEVRDVEACRKVHVQVIAGSWGYNSRKVLEKAEPDIIVDKPSALIRAISCLDR